MEACRFDGMLLFHYLIQYNLCLGINNNIFYRGYSLIFCAFLDFSAILLIFYLVTVPALLLRSNQQSV